METKADGKIRVEDYRLFLNRHYVRKATQVIFPDGKVVHLIEKMPKGLAIKQAMELIAKGRV